MDNNSSVDIRIILNNDFFIQPATCLTDLIWEKYEIFGFLEIYRKFLVFNFSTADFSQNKRCLRYVRAQHSELFHVFARRLAYEMVNI